MSVILPNVANVEIDVAAIIKLMKLVTMVGILRTRVVVAPMTVVVMKKIIKMTTIKLKIKKKIKVKKIVVKILNQSIDVVILI